MIVLLSILFTGIIFWSCNTSPTNNASDKKMEEEVLPEVQSQVIGSLNKHYYKGTGIR